MNKPENKLNRPTGRKEIQAASNNQPRPTNIQTEISPDKMLLSIRALGEKTLQDYEIRDLVKEAEALGRHLKEIGLKTNQIRKFLDAVNQLKVKLAQDKEQKISTIETELVMLKPKLAYAAARQLDRNNFSPVQPLQEVISKAIDKVQDSEDFHRLVQIIESIIAYHKAAGGKDQ